jgi:hypothetical protein
MPFEMCAEISDDASAVDNHESSSHPRQEPSREVIPPDLVEDELLRQRIRQFIADVPAQSRISRLLAHSLSSVLVGFLLSGLIGWGLTTCYAQKQSDLAARHARYEASNRAISEIAHIMYHRYARSVMLKSSFIREAPLDEIRVRKRDYDEAYVEWVTNVDATLHLMHRISGDAPYEVLKLTVEEEHEHSLDAIDQCLTNAYDYRMQGDAVDKAEVFKRFDDCRDLDANFTKALESNAKIIDKLFALAAKQLNAR